MRWLLVSAIQNPAILERCERLLLELRLDIAVRGPWEFWDLWVFDRIYGTRKRNVLRDLYCQWVKYCDIWKRATESERAMIKELTPEKLKEAILNQLDKEIQRLRAEAKTKSRLAKLEVVRRKVPEGAGFDRFLRYQANVQRDYDRTLEQLERMQRLRREQAFPVKGNESTWSS